jgi:hypothetical protein
MKKISSGVIFWITFALFLVGLVAVNYERIRQTIVQSKLPRSITYLFAKKSDEPLLNKPTSQGPSGRPADIIDLTEIIGDSEPVENVESLEQEIAPPERVEPPPPPAVLTATLYFVRIDADGNLIQVPVKKDFPYTKAPLTALLSYLIGGASAEERQAGLVSFIPNGTRLLSTVVQNGTAYISFNENFRYNTFGSDGYAAQIKQVIWTATEFATVNNVQILIEGKKESYLGDSFFIGDPLDRESLR